MSLGWNTESALMPSKAKKISAPKGSMEELKSQVFKSSMDAASKVGSGRVGKYARGTATARRGAADELDSAGRKRPKGGSRKRRQADDEEKEEEDEREAASRRKLAAKAQLYEDLRAGEASAPPELLVNFGPNGGGDGPRRDEFGRDARDAARGDVEAPARVADEDHGGGTRWAWSQGEASHASADLPMAEMLEVAARRARDKEEEAGANDDGRDATGVKSQWEKTLNRSEKSHLSDIHAETEKARQEAPARIAARDARVKGLVALQARLAAQQEPPAP